MSVSVSRHRAFISMRLACFFGGILALGAVCAGGWFYFNKIYIPKGSPTVFLILVEDLTQYAKRHSYYDITTDSIITNSRVPSYYITENGLISRLGGPLQVQVPPPYNSFRLEFLDLSRPDCVNFLVGGDAFEDLRLRSHRIEVNDIETNRTWPSAASCDLEAGNKIVLSYQ